jgi:hypothetical protein
MAILIHVALSRFHPALFERNPSTDDYSEDQQATFFVVQPFCEKKDLKNYVNDNSETEYALITNEDPTTEYIPVPLKPNTNLKLYMTIEGNGEIHSFEHLTSEEKFFKLNEYEWAQFAILSQSIPFKDKFEELTGPQKDSVYRALFSMAVQMHQERDYWNGNGDDSSDPRTILWAEIKNQQSISIEDIRELDNLATIYSKFSTFSPQASTSSRTRVASSLPRYEWEPVHLLNQHTTLFNPSTYIENLWKALKKSLAETGGAQQLEEALRRLFFFGERLAWPIAKKMPPHPFMVLRKNLVDVQPNGIPNAIVCKNWFITNAVSLMGLVFRISPQDQARPLRLQNARLVINNKEFSLYDDDIKNQNDFSDRVFSERATPKPFIAISELERTILFTPRQAPLLKFELDRATHFVVGEALLDVADEEARYAQASPGALPGRATRPIGLRMKDVAGLYIHEKDHGNTETVGWVENENIKSQFHCFQRVQADLILLPWAESLLTGTGDTTNSATYYELRLNESIDSNEKKKILERKLLLIYSSTDPGKIMKLDQENFIKPDTFDDISLGCITPTGDEGKKLLQEIFDSSDRRVTLLYEANANDQVSFDMLKFRGEQNESIDVVLVLNKGGVSRLGLTTDRIALSLYARWSPGFEPAFQTPPMSPAVSQAAETDKLRLHLRYEAEPTLLFPLSNPDALLPLPGKNITENDKAPWESSQQVLCKEGPQAAYWLVHHFDHAASTIEGERSIADAERMRFFLWNNAGKDKTFQLTGYFEHQYGHRIDLRSDQQLILKRATDIVNPASMFFGKQTESTDSSNTLYSLIIAREDPQNTLNIGFSKPALQHACASCFESHNTTTADPFSDLRRLYRSFGELRDAIENKSAHLVIEGWTFDNKKILGLGKGVTLADGLIMIEPPIESLLQIPSDSDLHSIFETLDRSLDDFINAIHKATHGPDLNLTDNVLLANYDIAVIADKASVLRIGIRIERAEILKPAWADWKDATWAYLPAAPMDRNTETTQQNPPQNLRKGLINIAKRELEIYLDHPVSGNPGQTSSYLHQTLSWILNPKQDQYAPLLGPAASSFLIPQTRTHTAKPSIGEMQAYYLPYAFMLPKASPLMGDRQSTFDFACFLLLLVEDIIEGRSITDRVKLTEVTNYITVRQKLQDKLPTIAKNLINLFAPVFKDYSNTGMKLFKEWCDWKQTDNTNAPESPLEAIQFLLIKQPSLYQKLRGIGFIVFDPESFSPELYQLKLNKRIFSYFSAPNSSLLQSTLSSFDIEALRGRWNGNNDHTTRCAYFIDLLADKQYDDGFIIDNKLLYRSEDIIEQKRFNNGPLPSYELDLKCSTEEWLYDNKPFILLPERRLPPLPRPVRVTAESTEATADPAQSLLSTASTEEWNIAYSKCTQHLNKLHLSVQSQIAGNPSKLYFASADCNDSAPFPLPSASLSTISNEWKYLTSSLAHSYFVFDLQVSADSNETYFDILTDLVFEIETEMWSPEPPESSHSSPPEAPQNSSQNSDYNSLTKAFESYRKAQSGGSSSPVSIKVNSLFDMIDDLLVKGELLKPEPEEANTESDNNGATPKLIHQESTRIDFSNPKWSISQGNCSFGCVVGFEILPQVNDSTQKIDINSPAKPSSAIIRISVLDHPFYVTRTRLRILRNWVDLDRDTKSDINPAFILSSGYSPWACEGRQPLLIDLRDHTPPLSLTIETTDVATWLDKESCDASQMLMDMLFPEAAIFPKEFLISNDYNVTATIYRTILDGSIRFGKENKTEPILERSITAVRQILRDKGGNLQTLLKKLSPAEIMTLFPWIQLSWRDATDHPLLTIQANITITETNQH